MRSASLQAYSTLYSLKQIVVTSLQVFKFVKSSVSLGGDIAATTFVSPVKDYLINRRFNSYTAIIAISV